MALQHYSKWFAVEDAKIKKMLTDPDGGAATYATIIDVPGIKAATLNWTIETKVLRGDNKKLDEQSKLVDLGIEVDHAKLQLDVLAILIGGTVTDSGTTPNQKVSYDLLGASNGSYFGFEAKTPTDGIDIIGGDGHFVLHKLRASNVKDYGFAEEDYKTVGFSAGASPRIADDKWLQIVMNETQLAIA
jgi:hypothetical protein